MLFTSYYAKLQHDAEAFEAMILIVASNGISRFLPKETRDRLTRKYQPLVKPDWNIVDKAKKGIITEDQYTTAYLEMLNAKFADDPEPFYEIIQEAALHDVVLFCYEKSGKFCHRTILGSWLDEKASELGINLSVEEFDWDGS